LAWVEAVRALVGIVVAPVAGVISDRFEKRLVLQWTRILLIFTNLALAILIFLGMLQLWHIVVVTIFEALIYTVMDPALQSIIPELVSRELLLSAISTTFVVEGVLHIVGAAAAGVIIESFGAGWVFLANAPMFALAAFALSRMPKGIVASSHGSVHMDFMAGLRYLRASPILIALVALAFARLVFMQPYGSFLAAFSRNDLHFDATGLGLLTAAAGVGGLLSSLVIASMGETRNKGRLVLGSGIIAATSVVLLMVVRTSLWPFVFVIMGGVFANAADIFTRTLMQSLCDAGYRARVASVANVFSYMVMLSVIPAGMLADIYGVPMIVGALAAIVIVVHVAATIWSPSLRSLD
jgi:MFS family permease